jgi:hypothetical protein
VAIAAGSGAAAVILDVLFAQAVLPPLAVAAGLVGVLVAVGFIERVLIPPATSAE